MLRCLFYLNAVYKKYEKRQELIIFVKLNLSYGNNIIFEEIRIVLIGS